jgi:hypothetical protein
VSWRLVSCHQQKLARNSPDILILGELVLAVLFAQAILDGLLRHGRISRVLTLDPVCAVPGLFGQGMPPSHCGHAARRMQPLQEALKRGDPARRSAAAGNDQNSATSAFKTISRSHRGPETFSRQSPGPFSYLRIREMRDG